MCGMCGAACDLTGEFWAVWPAIWSVGVAGSCMLGGVTAGVAAWLTDINDLVIGVVHLAPWLGCAQRGKWPGCMERGSCSRLLGRDGQHDEAAEQHVDASE